MNRRDFIKSSSAALAAGAALGSLPGIAPGTAADARLMRHRFGVNYVPSQDWYYCWNDWNAGDIARDFDHIAEIGADHLRIMLIWPWFQPKPDAVSPAHLDRLEELMRLAAARKLDVLATLYNGWLSGIRFTPPYPENEPFYTSPAWLPVRELYLAEVSELLAPHANFGLRSRQRNQLLLVVPAGGGRRLDGGRFQENARAVSGAHPRQWRGSTAVVQGHYLFSAGPGGAAGDRDLALLAVLERRAPILRRPRQTLHPIAGGDGGAGA